MFYLDLFRALDDHRVEYALIGGLAVALHGVERNTMDIDISVVMSPENLQHLVAAARALGLTPMLPVKLETLADLDTLQQWHSQRNLQAFALRSNALAGVTLDVLLFPPVDAGALCEGKLGSDEDYSSHLGQQQSFLRVCPRSSLQDHAAQGDCLPRRMMRWPVYFL